MSTLARGTMSRLIGLFELPAPLVIRDASFECAAWWRNIHVEAGRYPVHMDRDNVFVTFSGTEGASYFGALWGGVPVVRQGTPQERGFDRDMGRAIDYVQQLRAHDVARQLSGESPVMHGGKWILPGVSYRVESFWLTRAAAQQYSHDYRDAWTGPVGKWHTFPRLTGQRLLTTAVPS